MVPPAHMERVLTSSGVKPTCGPVMVAADRRDLMMLVLRTDVNLFWWNTLAKGVWPMVP